MIEFTEDEVRAIRVLADFAAKRCGGGEDLLGAFLYSGARRQLPADDTALVDLVHKIESVTVRQTYYLKGPLQLCPNIEVCHNIVRQTFPDARRHGSMGHWTWTADDKCEGPVLAEAWIGDDNMWHLKLRK